MTVNITFTPAASQYIEKMIAKEHGLGLRLTIKKTGCSGYSYQPEMVSQINPKDIFFQLENHVMVYVDRKWLHLLQQLHVDFIEEEKSGIKQKRLVFSNPQETSRCGCGESFHVASEKEEG